MASKKTKTQKKSNGESENKVKEVKTPSKSTIGLLSRLPLLKKMLYKGEKEQVFNLAMAKNASSNKLPSVNLLPSNVNLKVILRRTRFSLILATVAILLITGLTWLTQTFTINVADRGLIAAKEQVARSQTIANSYSPIQQFLDSLKSRTIMANEKVGPQINYPTLLTKVKAAIGNTSSISNISTKLITAPAAGTTTTTTSNNTQASQCGPVDDPFATATIPLVACLSFNGSTTDRNEITAITNRLTAIPFLSNVSLITSQNGVTNYTFAGTAAISNEIFLPVLAVLK